MIDPLSDMHDEKPSARRVYRVSEITRRIRGVLEETFDEIWLEGEISNFTAHRSGHFYFSLKDAESQISCVMWRGRNLSMVFRPADGMKVVAFGRITVYEQGGRYQLDVMQLRPAGVGDLQMAFDALKRKLDAEGLFRQEIKKNIPEFPERIGIVTSPTGAAIQDFISVISRRYPPAQIILAPVRVQGEFAAEEIARAVRQFNAFKNVDVLIVGRGGGSLEDLWAFNEEIVVRAVAESEIPIISAVGHEIDFTLSDFAADLRAPTPSAAAELVVPDQAELTAALRHLSLRLQQNFSGLFNTYANQLDVMRESYAFRDVLNRVREYEMRIDENERRLVSTTEQNLDYRTLNLSALRGKLNAMHPEKILKRGYSITRRKSTGQIFRDQSEIHIDDEVVTQMAWGKFVSKITAERED